MHRVLKKSGATPGVGLFRLAATASCLLFLAAPSVVQGQEDAAWIYATESADTMHFIDANSLAWQGQALTGWRIVYYQKTTPGTPSWGWLMRARVC